MEQELAIVSDEMESGNKGAPSGGNVLAPKAGAAGEEEEEAAMTGRDTVETDAAIEEEVDAPKLEPPLDEALKTRDQVLRKISLNLRIQENDLRHIHTRPSQLLQK